MRRSASAAGFRPARFEPRQEKVVDRVAGPGPRRRRRAGSGLVTGPNDQCRLRAARSNAGAAALASATDSRGHGAPRSIQAVRVAICSGLQFSGRRHLVAGVVDRLDEQAPAGLAGNDRGAAVAPGQHQVAVVEPQVARLLVRAVAFEAVGGQQRSDGLLELLDLGRGEARFRLGRRAVSPRAAKRRPARMRRRRASRRGGAGSSAAGPVRQRGDAAGGGRDRRSYPLRVASAHLFRAAPRAIVEIATTQKRTPPVR